MDVKNSPVAQRQIPLLDLQAQHRHIREEVMAEVTRVIDSQKFIMGEEVQKLEREIAAYSGAQFGVGCASGLRPAASSSALAERPRASRISPMTQDRGPVSNCGTADACENWVM